jgi:hypothetical protein
VPRDGVRIDTDSSANLANSDLAHRLCVFVVTVRSQSIHCQLRDLSGGDAAIAACPLPSLIYFDIHCGAGDPRGVMPTAGFRPAARCL